MPADFNHHAVKELEPLAIIDRQSPAAVALRVLSACPFRLNYGWPSTIYRFAVAILESPGRPAVGVTVRILGAGQAEGDRLRSWAENGRR
jgi:hypothetical protein